MKGPITLFLAWAVHDIEEIFAFPSDCDRLADLSGIEGLRMDLRQSAAAVGLMGVVIAAGCVRGARSTGKSRLYRAVVAGLEAHVGTHLFASVVRRTYTAGVATALPVMLPGAIVARRELERLDEPLETRDYMAGAAILGPLALACHVVARQIPSQKAA